MRKYGSKNLIDLVMCFADQIENIVEAHYKDQKKSSFYAGQIGISVKSLNCILKRERGKTIAQLLEERVLLEAMHLLKNTDMLVKTIAYELEFCDPGHFNRMFKKIQGITPVAFRRIHSKN